MQRGTRTLVAVGVILAGLTAALMFRHAPSAPPAPPPSDPLLIRKASSVAPRVAVERPAARIEAHEPVAVPPRRAPSAGVPLPVESDRLDREEAPPELPRSYPGSAAAALPPASEPAGSVRNHKIIDGDTLAALAERYLGRADRAGEIFEVNRDVLTCPELLPIGARLRIPPRGPEPGSTPGRTSE